jgi:hypothetical protein
LRSLVWMNPFGLDPRPRDRTTSESIGSAERGRVKPTCRKKLENRVGHEVGGGAASGRAAALRAHREIACGAVFAVELASSLTSIVRSSV